MTAPPTVRVEAIAWVTRFVGGDGSRRRVFTLPLGSGDTVRSVLRRISRDYPELEAFLWDAPTGGLSEHVEVLVNDCVLGVRHDLDSPLQPGDTVSLVGQYMGGCGLLPIRTESFQGCGSCFVLRQAQHERISQAHHDRTIRPEHVKKVEKIIGHCLQGDSQPPA